MATLTQWLNDTWKHLTFDDEIVGKNGSGMNVSGKNVSGMNVSVIKIPEINIELTSGLFSTDDLEEFNDLAFHLSPVGTIKDKINEDYYNDKLLRARNILTKQILTTKNSKLAKQYMEILERRDRKRWQKDTKELKATATDSEGKAINVTFTTI